jgi:hypothetical protein
MFHFQEIVLPTADTTNPFVLGWWITLLAVTILVIWQLRWLSSRTKEVQQPKLAPTNVAASEPSDVPSPVPVTRTGETICPLPTPSVGQDKPERPFLGRRHPLRALTTVPRPRLVTITPEPIPESRTRLETLEVRPAITGWPEPVTHLKVYPSGKTSMDAGKAPEAKEVQGVREAPGPSRDGIGEKCQGRTRRADRTGMPERAGSEKGHRAPLTVTRGGQAAKPKEGTVVPS